MPRHPPEIELSSPTPIAASVYCHLTMRIYTCTPVRFKGDLTFFSRDSGLLSVGLEMNGIDSRPVMPGPPMDDDDPRLIRTDYSNLESSDWWRSLKLDGLVFYSWAAPKYNPIAFAIRNAGIPFIVNMDTTGLVSPLANRQDWLREIHVAAWGTGIGIFHKSTNFLNAIMELISARVAKRRIPHYEAATAIGVVTPYAMQWLTKEAAALGRTDLKSKFNYVPHAQMPHFLYDGRPKKKLVISVGRWQPEDWPQKNPRVLLLAYREFLKRNHDWSGLIIGSGAPELPERLGMDVSMLSDRLTFRNQVNTDQLPDIYNDARIGFWTSRWEAQQGTAAQALCCGCTVVGPSSALNNCFRHYISRESGRIPIRDNVNSFVDALIVEAASWENGERDPSRISRIWSDEFHAPAVAARCIDILGLSKQ
jgi:glycosyltransferase involved in cell wall biosynthesis